MVETNPIVNPVNGRQWDQNSLIEKLLELQDALLQSQEKHITLTAQARELERVARDADDLKAELANKGQLLTDKSRENKHLHQELSRMALLDAKMQEAEDLKSVIADMQHQLRTVQSERDQLGMMLTELENQSRGRRDTEQSFPGSREAQGTSGGWLKYLKGKQS